MFIERINTHEKETVKVDAELKVVNSKWTNLLISSPVLAYLFVLSFIK